MVKILIRGFQKKIYQKMDYWVTLIKKDVNKNDKLSFRTNLREPLIFQNKQYKVGLTDIIVNNPFEVYIGSVRIYDHKGFLEKNVDVYASHGELVSNILEKVNNELLDHYIDKAYRNKANDLFEFNSKEEFFNYFRHTPQIYSHTQLIFNQNYLNLAYIEKNGLKSNDINNLKTARFWGLMDDLVGWFKIISGEGPKYPIDNLYQKRVQLNEPYFIKTNIIDYQPFGSTHQPILRSFSINSTNNHIQFTNTHYINVNKTEIYQILIEITDLDGNTIKTRNLNICLTLHFKENELFCDASK